MPERINKKLLILGTIFFSAQVILNLLKYYNLNTDISDLGSFQNILWNICNGDPSYIKFLVGGHFYPSLLFYLLFYRLLPFAETLIILQSLGITLGLIPLYLLARELLDDRYAMTVSLMYVLFPYNWFVSLYPFHPDHMVIPFGLLLFYFLHKDNLKWMVITSLFMVTFRELFFFSASFSFIFYAIHQRRFKIGLGLAAMFFLIGLLYIDYITPLIQPSKITIVHGHPAIGYLGSSIREIIMNILSRPVMTLEHVLKLEKVLTISGFFGFFLLIPLLSPFALIPALPALAMAMLSRMPQYYLMIFHYSAGATPFVFGAFVMGLARFKDRMIVRQMRYLFLPAAVLVLSAYFVFFSVIKYTDYNIKLFRITERSSMVRKAVYSHIPENPDISLSITQDTNLNRLVNRKSITYFPGGVIKPARTFDGREFLADYAIVDTRPIYDTVRRFLKEKGTVPGLEFENYEELKRGLAFALINYDILFQSDGFYIFKKRS